MVLVFCPSALGWARAPAIRDPAALDANSLIRVTVAVQQDIDAALVLAPTAILACMLVVQRSAEQRHALALERPPVSGWGELNRAQVRTQQRRRIGGRHGRRDYRM
jgi:hypothetical protein